MRYDLAFPLTPALSPGERENRSPAFDKSKRGVCVTVIGKSCSVRMLSPLPEGEGQGEGKQRELRFRASKSLVDRRIYSVSKLNHHRTKTLLMKTRFPRLFAAFALAIPAVYIWTNPQLEPID